MTKLFDLTGKVAVVTGASGFLGRHFVKALEQAGARVIGVDVKSPAEKLDITDEKAVEAWVEKQEKIDILVNSAANQSTKFCPLEEFSLSEWEAEMKVNLTGTFLMSRAVGQQMAKQKSGSIINISSIYGVVGPNFSIYKGTAIKGTPLVYSVTKAGIIGMTKYLASYWGAKQVRVNAITPGGVYNQQDKKFVANYSQHVPLGRMAQPKDLLGALIYLASDASSYVTGQNLMVDGGWTAW